MNFFAFLAGELLKVGEWGGLMFAFCLMYAGKDEDDDVATFPVG